MANKIEIKAPDLGGVSSADLIEILVKVGDEVKKETSLITLESEKASMDIPSPVEGKILSLNVKIGDKISTGTLIATIEPKDSAIEEKATSSKTENPKPEITAPVTTNDNAEQILASPAVRKFARESGVKLEDVQGSGRKARVLKEDIVANIDSGFNVNISTDKLVERKPLSKIKRLTGVQMSKSWNTIPHVTQFDEADITELEEFRKTEAKKLTSSDFKLTPLAFICKTVAVALQHYPQFNSSLDLEANELMYKKYINIGIAVETPQGLVVPVIKNVDRLSILDIAKEMARLSNKARTTGLEMKDMQDGCFTISSLGGIGGTAFTPIVNSPEVAILGVSRAKICPIYDGQNFQPRLMLPLSLSYDHRVIDGAEAARFTSFICEKLADIRRILLG